MRRPLEAIERHFRVALQRVRDASDDRLKPLAERAPGKAVERFVVGGEGVSATGGERRTRERWEAWV